MTGQTEQYDPKIIERMQFVKVAVREHWPSGGSDLHFGYLTEVSGKMLLVELRRLGFNVVPASDR